MCCSIRNSQTGSGFLIGDHLTHAAVAWLVQNLDLFEVDSQLTSARLKPLTELALLLIQRDGRSGARTDSWLAMAADLVLRTQRRDDVADYVWRHHDTFVPHLLRAVSVKELAEAEWEAERTRLQRLLDHSGLQHAERLPFQQLEFRYALDLANLRHNLSSASRLFEATLAAHVDSPVFLSEFDAYTVTHAIFFATSFGRRALDIKDARLQRLAATLRDLLDVYLYIEHWDLVTELMLASMCIGDTRSRQFRQTMNALRVAQRPDGSMPGPAAMGNVTAGDTGHARRVQFDWCYHTTIVAAMLGGQREL